MKSCENPARKFFASVQVCRSRALISRSCQGRQGRSQVRIPGHFPQVIIRIRKVPVIAAPRGLLGGLGELCPCLHCLVKNLVYFLARRDIVGYGEPSESRPRTRNLGIFGQLIRVRVSYPASGKTQLPANCWSGEAPTPLRRKPLNAAGSRLPG